MEPKYHSVQEDDIESYFNAKTQTSGKGETTQKMAFYQAATENPEETQEQYEA